MPDWFCITCGAHWSEGAYTDDCEECGGGAMERDCIACGGRCGQKFVRAPIDSQDSHIAHWIGSCGLGHGRRRDES